MCEVEPLLKYIFYKLNLEVVTLILGYMHIIWQTGCVCSHLYCTHFHTTFLEEQNKQRLLSEEHSESTNLGTTGNK